MAITYKDSSLQFMPCFDVCFFFFYLLIVVAKLELFVEGGKLRQGALVGFYLDLYEKEEKY
jgi:hypothetical protein